MFSYIFQSPCHVKHFVTWVLFKERKKKNGGRRCLPSLVIGYRLNKLDITHPSLSITVCKIASCCFSLGLFFIPSWATSTCWLDLFFFFLLYPVIQLLMKQFFLKCQAVPQKSVDNCKSSAEIQRSQILRIDSDIKAGNSDIIGTSATKTWLPEDQASISCCVMFSIITSSGCPLPLWSTPKYPLLSVLHKKGPHRFSFFYFLSWFARFAVICQSPHDIFPSEETSEEYWVSRWVCNWRLNYSPYCNAESSLRQVFTNSQDCFWDRDAIWSRAIYPCVNMSEHHFSFL